MRATKTSSRRIHFPFIRRVTARQNSLLFLMKTDYFDPAVASRTPNSTTRLKIPLFWTRNIHLSDSSFFKRIATTTTQALNILEIPLNCITGFFCRAVLRQVINACHACRRQKAAGLPPQMADLPLCRFPTDKPFPFLHCGLDIFGPFPVFN